jgi:hypothetical protein
MAERAPNRMELFGLSLEFYPDGRLAALRLSIGASGLLLIGFSLSTGYIGPGLLGAWRYFITLFR